jgi:hypothetical protein
MEFLDKKLLFLGKIIIIITIIIIIIIIIIIHCKWVCTRWQWYYCKQNNYKITYITKKQYTTHKIKNSKFHVLHTLKTQNGNFNVAKNLSRRISINKKGRNTGGPELEGCCSLRRPGPTNGRLAKMMMVMMMRDC